MYVNIFPIREAEAEISQVLVVPGQRGDPVSKFKKTNE